MLSRIKMAALFSTILLTALFGESAFARPALSYRISKTILLGAPDRWDYIGFDPVLNRVYVSHGGTVTVVDGDSGTVVGHVDGISGTTHGVVSVHAVGKGYTDDGNAGIAVSFNLKSLRVVNRIKAEPDADGIVYDPPSGHILVIDGDSGKITVIDPKTDTVVATIDSGGGLEFGVSNEKGKFYVNGAEKGEIVRIDTASNKADAHWPVPGCTSPHGLAMDKVNAVLFASCVNEVMTIVDAKTGQMLAQLPIGAGTDFAEFDPDRMLAFSSNRDGTLSIIAEESPTHFVALPAVQTEPGARTMALNGKTGRIYLVTSDMVKDVESNSGQPRNKVKPGSVKLLFLDPVLSRDLRK